MNGKALSDDRSGQPLAGSEAGFGFSYKPGDAAAFDEALWIVAAIVGFVLLLMIAAFVLGYLVGWNGSAC